jgi:uncharacterized membrane protein YfcA
VRVELLPDPRVFEAVVALVLIPLGAWILVSRRGEPVSKPSVHINSVVLGVLAAIVGCVGGIYGIGGGSILAPILVGSGRSPSEVAPATLASTFVTSIVGVVTFVTLSVEHQGPVSPDWGIGLALGVGGLVGGYAGARLQPHLPEMIIRRLLGLLVLVIGVRYAWLAWPG